MSHPLFRPPSAAIATVAFTLTLASILPGLASAQSPWSKIHNDASNNAVLDRAAQVTDVTAEPAWDTGAQSLAPRCGVSILGGLACTVATYGADTWTTTSDDRVTLKAFDAAGGAQRWESPALDLGLYITYDSNATPTADAATNAFYFGSGQTVYRLNVATGGIAWQTRLDAANTTDSVTTFDIVNSCPVLAAGRVFIETYGGFTPMNKQLVALDAETGAVLWARNDGGNGGATPCIAQVAGQPRVFTATQSGVNCYDLDGNLVWSHETVAAPWDTFNLIFGSIVYHAGRLYVATTSFDEIGELICVDAATGERLWHNELARSSTVAPLILGDKVYVQAGAFNKPTYLAAYDLATGGFTLEQATGGLTYNTFMAATRDRIYMTNASDLMILDPASGAVLSKSSGAWDGPVSLDARGGVYVHTASGRLVAFGETVPVELSAFTVE